MNFFKRPTYTLLYLSADKIVRLDSDRKGVIKGEMETFEVACESAGSVPVAIEKFFNHTQKPLGRKVWVLYTRLNSYHLSLPTVQVEGVAKLSDLLVEANDKLEALRVALATTAAKDDIEEQAMDYKFVVFEAMQALRKPCDELETIVAEDFWPFPTYTDLLFRV